MNKIIKWREHYIAASAISLPLTIVPESCLKCFKLVSTWTDDVTIIVNRILMSIVVYGLVLLCCRICAFFKKEVTISDDNYKLIVEYGDILKCDGKKVINFDECFTTKVGADTADIKPDSVCGQYLQRYPNPDIPHLIDRYKITSARSKSLYQNKTRYESGTILPVDKFLLLAFARLEKDGRGYMRYEEYVECLNKLWEEIDRYHGTDNVYLPILGSGVTRMDKDLTQQELLDIMINSYKISPYRLSKPYELHIVCKKSDEFSLRNISRE